MAYALHLPQIYRRTLGGVRGTMRALLRMVTTEHALALRATTKAALSRQSLTKVRSMYVAPQERRHDDHAT